MKTNSKKLALAGVLCAVAVVGSMLQFPVFGSQCAPVQHMVNVICAVFLGPGYGVAVAFLASLLRNIFGLGSLLAFPGSICCAAWSTGRPGICPRPWRARCSAPASSAACCPILWRWPLWA